MRDNPADGASGDYACHRNVDSAVDGSRPCVGQSEGLYHEGLARARDLIMKGWPE